MLSAEVYTAHGRINQTKKSLTPLFLGPYYRAMKKRQNASSVAILLLLALSCTLPGVAMAMQTEQPPSGATEPAPMSTEMRYGLLFRHIARFEAHAEKTALQGKPAEFLRLHHKDLYHLPDDLHAVLVIVARQCAAEVDDLDQRASAVIRAVKDKHRNRPRIEGGVVPPPPPELQALQQQRTQAVLRAVEQLEDSFGPAQFALFDSVVKRTVGQHLRVVSIP